jgi:hypothetical protein
MAERGAAKRGWSRQHPEGHPMISTACWCILAAIHALPAVALIRPSLIAGLYGVRPGSDVFLLLQHRAALFMVVFVVCVWAAMRAETRRLASVAVGLSMGSFLALYWHAGAPATLQVIAVADAIGLPVLAYAGWQAFRGPVPLKA